MPRSRSLRLRIALLYGALTSVALALCALAGHVLHRRAQYGDVDRSLSGIAQHVAAELAATHTRSEIDEILSTSTLLGAGALLYLHDGTLLGQSRTGALAPRFQLRSMLPVPVRAAGGNGGYRILGDASGHRWRIHVVALNGGERYLVATLPLLAADRSVAEFARWMIVIAVAGSAATVFAGWLLARRALRPVAILTAGARAQSRAFSRRATDNEDVDELDRLALTFNDMLAAVHGAYEVQQRFIAAASHELRAPLTIVTANLEFLQQEHRLNERDRADTITEAYNEAGRMGRLVANLLLLARADAGVPLLRQPVDLDRVLLEVVAELGHAGRGRVPRVEQFEPIVVYGDRDRLKQLVLILVDNAMKYGDSVAGVTVGLSSEARIAVLRVSDTGSGMSPADMARAFERFHRADNARVADPGGTGLGLSIARWIAEEHDGTIELTTALGHGTTATVRLPIDR